MKRTMIVGFASVVLAFSPAGPAWADGPTVQGWWTTTTPLATPGSPPVSGSTTAPDVPPRGLLVQAVDSPTAPTAFAALAFTIQNPESPRKLTLHIAPNSLTTPMSELKVCPLTSRQFKPTQGGPMSEAPKFDCARSVVASPTNGTYSFDLAKFPVVTGLNVALLPVAAGDRVVLTQPGADALSLGAEPEASTIPVSTGTAPPTSMPESGPPLLDHSGAQLGSQPLSTPQPLTQSAPAVAPQAAPLLNSPVAAVTPTRLVTDPRRVTLLLVLSAFVVLAWRAAGAESEPREVSP